MDKDEHIPLISEKLVEALNEKFHVDSLLFESKNLEGLEQLGFLKGARFILLCINNISIQQREDVNNG